MYIGRKAKRATYHVASSGRQFSADPCAQMTDPRSSVSIRLAAKSY
jgi:hypothetical protein